MTGWNATRIPDQSGRTAVVTGANSGIGYVTARELARHGASVVLACRSAARGRDAVSRLRREVASCDVRFLALDLADLSSVRQFARDFVRHRPALDLLVNNAGVMALPYGRTADGFETQFGVNHLGHFALTGLLLPRLLAAAPGARIVNVSSVLHALGRPGPSFEGTERDYRRWTAYGRSKSANLLFTHALARRFTAAGSAITAAAAHPGYASTNLHAGASRPEGRSLAARVMALGNGVLAQPAAAGALPTLYAATAPGVRQDEFFGPRLGWRGAPVRSWRARWTLDDAAGERLWSTSEKLTGVTFPPLAP
ncbi:oxidoreductase [Streptomyces sp. NPDC048352]|uniref:oxidoreductase n=1 Tax=Streptomyces sp. NPDC048352 TaxID=3154718 RepID=UPI0034387DE5